MEITPLKGIWALDPYHGIRPRQGDYSTNPAA